jgi:hypothetical protein
MDGDRAIPTDHVTGVLTYLVPNGKKPVSYQYDPPPGIPVRSGQYEDRAVPVRNGRSLTRELSLDKHGFIITRHDTKVADLGDEAEVTSVYYAEMEQLLKDVTGADRVLVFDHTIRSVPLASQGRKGIREPVKRVHNDYTVKSGPQRVRDLLPDEAEELLKGRVQVINVWRPLAGPLRDSPLALCDATSVRFEDLVPSDLVYPNRVGETYSVKYHAAHRWFYVPAMQRDEALLLKCADTRRDVPARFTPHSAFADPTTPADAAPRQSIEARTLVFHR